ncbi:MAG: hypothetical protein DWQ36_17615 [Acidobacteria bacterium]|nr:MAG: hypothetical protein DWQ30_15935 [Acidobacteriota bacterium]REK04259.1 MAG: hypothetical protein DWQ36_17615 [Acidobacteriota bacterium]
MVSDRRLLFYSLVSALYALLPIPLLDDSLIRRDRRKMVRELAAARGLSLSDDQVLILSGTVPKSGWGCLFALLVSIPLKIFYKLLRRVFRSIFFWLAIKDAVEAASATFHEGYLVRAGLDRAPPQPEKATLEVRRAANAVLAEVDTRPFQRLLRAAFRASVGGLRAAVRRLTGGRRRIPASQAPSQEQVEQEVPDELLDRLESDLAGQRSYLEDLGHRMAAHQARLAEAAPDPPVG